VDKKRVSRRDLERLLEHIAAEALTPENARADLDELMASAPGGTELDELVKRTWNRIRAAMRPSVGDCVNAHLECEGLSAADLAADLGVPLPTIETLAGRTDAIDSVTIAGVTFQLATALGIDYGRLVRCLSRGLAAWHAMRDPQRRPLLLIKAARSETTAKTKGDPDVDEGAGKPPCRG
jgi:plasmid maintenance system antidote protein VapI